jgi:DeoR/GlpR family transcriptional regulator of sugar metabolism
MDHSDAPELVADRHHWLLEKLRAERRLTTNDAAQALGMSVDTVRRDLRALHDAGRLRRVHGGAVPLANIADSFTGRRDDAAPAQAGLAAAVVSRFRAGQLIGLDAGSTNVEVARQIPHTLEVTIVTNSPAAAVALADHGSAQVILLGGTVDLTWMATTGAETVDAWRSHRLDLAVVGVCGFDIDEGAFTRSPHEVATKRALIDVAADTVVPVQSEKLDAHGPFHVVAPTAVDTLVLESSTTPALIERYRAANFEVIVADV